LHQRLDGERLDASPSLEEGVMPKYLIEASYTRDGVAGVLAKGGSSRREAVRDTVAGMGGELECFYFGFGDHDAFVIVDVPDNEAAAAVAMTVSASGGAVATTTVLLTPEQVDEAARRSVDYRAPGS
jgi:uncharacterized protein with GYD domain